MANKEVRKIAKTLKRLGWQVEQGRVHYKAVHPKGDILTMSVTPSDHHAIANIKSDVNRVRRRHNEERVW